MTHVTRTGFSIVLSFEVEKIFRYKHAKCGRRRLSLHSWLHLERGYRNDIKRFFVN